jgi:hypothetical protein
LSHGSIGIERLLSGYLTHLSHSVVDGECSEKSISSIQILSIRCDFIESCNGNT